MGMSGRSGTCNDAHQVPETFLLLHPLLIHSERGKEEGEVLVFCPGSGGDQKAGGVAGPRIRRRTRTRRKCRKRIRRRTSGTNSRRSSHIVRGISSGMVAARRERSAPRSPGESGRNCSGGRS